MKKIILTIILGLGLVGIANASLWNYYNGNLPSITDRASEALKCGISDYIGSYDQNIRLEKCLRDGGTQLGAAPFRPSDIDIKIRQFIVQGASRTGNTINIDPIVTTDGHRWEMSDIGDIAFATIDPGTSNKEIISWTGMTDNTSFYTLTGVEWGYDSTGLTTSTANFKRHNSGARFIITNDDQFLRYQYVNKYDGLMRDNYNPTSDQQVATVGFVENRNGYWEAAVANFAALPTGVNNGETRVTLDDSKVYVWNGSSWILAGSGGGAGTIYRDDIVVTSSAQLTYSLSSGSWPDTKYLTVYRNGTLLTEGSGNDYTAPTTGNTITLLSAPVVGEVITLRVESIDFYNANWTSVNDDLLPDVTATHNIGSTTKQFKDLYLSGNVSIGGTLGVTGTTTLATTTVPSVVTTGTSTASTNVVNQAFVSDFSANLFTSSSQPTRTVSSTYTNTTGKVMFVTISVSVTPPTNNAHYAYLDVFANGLTIATIGTKSGAEVADTTESNRKRHFVSFYVAPGKTYGSNYARTGSGDVTLEYWTEFTNK